MASQLVVLEMPRASVMALVMVGLAVGAQNLMGLMDPFMGTRLLQTKVAAMAESDLVQVVAVESAVAL